MQALIPKLGKEDLRIVRDLIDRQLAGNDDTTIIAADLIRGVEKINDLHMLQIVQAIVDSKVESLKRSIHK